MFKKIKENSDDILYVIFAILIVIAILAVSCAATVGIVYLICKCFSWPFTIWYGVGVWLILTLISGIFKVTVSL